MKKFFDIAPSYRQFYKEQKGEINLPSGATIFIRSADNPLGIEGITAFWVWLDEGGQCSELTWTVLRSRVSMTGGQIFITTTPYNMGWLYKGFFLPWKEGRDKNLSFITWQSTDNPYFSKEFFEAERARLRPEEFFRRYLGEFRKMTGLVWDIPSEQIIEPIEDFNKTRTEARIIGVDWGYENPAAIAVLYLKDKNWYVVEEWKQSKRTTAEIIQVLKNKTKEHKATAVYPDPAEPDRIEECRRAGLPMMEANNDVKGGISGIQQLIREKHFWVFNTCKEFIDEASMYHYPEPKEDKDSVDLPVDFNNHLCCAVRYPIHSYQPTQYAMPQASPAILPFYPEVGF